MRTTSRSCRIRTSIGSDDAYSTQRTSEARLRKHQITRALLSFGSGNTPGAAFRYPVLLPEPGERVATEAWRRKARMNKVATLSWWSVAVLLAIVIIALMYAF